MMKLYGLALAACLFTANTAQAQLNDGGSTPRSLYHSQSSPALVVTPGLDLPKVLAEDSEEEKKGTFQRIGRAIPMNIDVRKTATSLDLGNGDRLYLLKIHSPDAIGINLYFSEFELPRGAVMHVYTPDYKRILGGYTMANNHESLLFATEHLDGAELIVEYYEPADAAGLGRLVINEVGHIYKTGGFGSSDNCQVNVNCSPEGTGKTQQRDAVARILVKVGAQQGYCTGSMVNNTSQNCTPYFLTALHCGTTGGGTLTTAADLNQWIFYFNYQSTGCSNGSKPTPNTLTGAVARANSNDGGGNTGSDFLLLQLNNSPQQSWNVFYAGWNRNNTASTSGYGIHHPSGDIKKISTYTSTLASTSWGGSVANTHWQVVWSATTNGHGVTEGGSSGSPLFNSSGLIVGTLTGGGSYCTATSSPDAYGKFSYHWDQNGTTAARRLRDWLDPGNTGATTLAGVYYPCVVNTNDAGISAIINPVDGQYLCTNPFTPQVELKNYGTANLTSVAIKYQINAGTVNTFNWTGTLASNATTTVTLPNQTAPVGTFTFRSYTMTPNGVTDPNNSNDTSTAVTAVDVAIPLPYSEPFNAGAMPTNINVYDPDGDGFEWEHTTAATATGSGAGFGSALFDNYNGTSGSNPGGTIDWMILPSLDFTGASSTDMTFDVAYRRYNTSTNDTLIVAVSTNCSPTYTIVYKKGGTALATVGTTSTTSFVPTQAQWRNETIDLSAYDGDANVSIAFINYSDWGQNLYVDNINIQSSCSMTASISAQTNVGCFGASTGTATVTPSGGTSPYTYAWSSGQTTATITGLNAGTRTVTVTDAGGCTASASVTITQPSAALSITKTTSNVTCNGAANGSINITVSGGTTAYSFNWGGGVTTEDRTGLAPGTYTVTVTDANGCTATNSTTITQPTALSITKTQTNVTCFGASTGAINITVSGGTTAYSFNWGGGVTTEDRTGLAAGTYTVTVTDANGCTASNTTTITQPASGMSVTKTTTNVLCNGGNTGAINITVSGGSSPYTYNWGGGVTTEDRTGLVAGTYTVTITDNGGCTTTNSTTITQPNAISITKTTSNVTCNGAANGSINITVSGGTSGYSFNWGGGITTEDRTGLAPGTYTVTVTDANGCTATNSTTITQPTALSITKTATNVTCNGAANGSINITVSGGTTAYSFNWGGGVTTEDRTGLAPGTYTVTVTDANGCTATNSTTITQPTAVSISRTQTNVLCNGASTGAISITTSGGTSPYTYNWGGGVTIEDRTGLAAGTYTVTATDANGCTATNTTTITQPNAITTNTNAVGESCAGNDGTATVTASGGTGALTYLWANGQTTATATGLVAGTYNVTVTDANGCVKTATAIVPDNCNPCSVTLTNNVTNVSCNAACDGGISLTPTSGTAPYTYIWSNGGSGSSQTGLCPTSYSVTVSDALGCTAVFAATITEPSVLQASISAQTNVACFGDCSGNATVSASGGTAAYSYLWSNGTTVATAINLCAGNFDVTVTDANGCFVSTNVTLTQPVSAISVTASATNASCTAADGTASASASGGTAPYTFAWSNSASTANISGLAAGNYSVTVTDANGCAGVASVTVGSTGNVSASISSTSNVLCNGASTGSATASGSSGTAPYTFAWSNGNTSATIINVAAGNYTVTVTDANGCAATAVATILQPSSALSVSAVSTDPTNGTDGTVDLTVSGGTTPYAFNWDNGANTEDLANLSAGIYTVTVTDANGCTATATAMLIFSGINDIAVLQQFQVMPNPNEGKFVIVVELANAQPTTVRITNVLGQVLRQYDFQQTSIQIPVDIVEQAGGVYFVNLLTDNGQATIKVVVAK